MTKARLIVREAYEKAPYRRVEATLVEGIANALDEEREALTKKITGELSKANEALGDLNKAIGPLNRLIQS